MNHGLHEQNRRITGVEWLLIGILNFLFLWILATQSGFFYLDNISHLYGSKYLWTAPSVILKPFAGRYCPVHFVLIGLYAPILGNTIQGLFIFQYLFLAAGFLLVFWFLTRAGCPPMVKWFLYAMLYTQSSFAENIFTVGKAESHFVFFLLCCVVFYLLFLYTDGKKSILWGSLLAISDFLMIFTKETGFSFIAFYLVYYLVMLLCKADQERRKRALQAILGHIVFVAVFFLLWRVLDSTTQAERSYTAIGFSIPQVLYNLYAYARDCTDILVLGALSIGASIYMLVKRRYSFAMNASISLCVFGVGYFCGLLLWRWPLSYYQLPTTSMLLLSVAFFLVHLLQEPVSQLRRGVVRACLVLFSVMLFFNIQYNYYVAVSHLDTGASFDGSMEYVADNLPEGSTLYVENWDNYLEPMDRVLMMQQYYYGRDIDAYGLGSSFYTGYMSDSDIEVYGTDDLAVPSPRVGDYILVYDNYRDLPIYMRGVGPYYEKSRVPKLAGYGYELDLLAADRNDRRMAMLHYTRMGLVQTYSGYSLYEITAEGRVQPVLGFNPELWFTELSIPGMTRNDYLLELTPTSFLVYPVNTLTLALDGEFLCDIPVSEEENVIDFSTYVPLDRLPADLTLTVKDTFVPAESLPGSQDQRTLGLQAVSNDLRMPEEISGFFEDGWFSALSFYGMEHNRYELVLSPASFEVYQENTVTLALDGKFVASVPVSVKDNIIDLSKYVPASLLPGTLTITVDQTFIPGQVWPESTDTRTLGLRVEAMPPSLTEKL